MSLDGQQYPHEDLRKQSRSRWPLTKGKEEKKKENLTEQLCRKSIQSIRHMKHLHFQM